MVSILGKRSSRPQLPLGLPARISHKLATAAPIFVLSVFPVFAAQRTLSLQAARIEKAPLLDGALTEESWRSAPDSQAFRQKEPREGEEATESTSIRALYTAHSLFLGIRCLHSLPDQVVATERRRDGDLLKDDSIWVLIDSFHDHRNAFLFATNALGTQYDALVGNEGKDVNPGWDGVWQVAARRDAQGWSAEIEIPFKALRFRDSTTEIGIEFRRVIRDKNEFAFWNNWNRNFPFEDVSRAGHLTGLKGIEIGTRWLLKGYAVGGAQRKGLDWTNPWNAGIEDFRRRLSPELAADFTYNTDFAEVEVDVQRGTLMNPRNQISFPEKREFFLEGAEFFDFNAQVNEIPADSFRAFFSRRIGLSEDGRRIPILGGGKLTGRMGAFSIGALGLQMKNTEQAESSHFSVLRLRRDLFSRSTAGVILTDRTGDHDFNRTAGADVRLALWNNFTFDGFVMRSFSPQVQTERDAYYARAYWRSDRWDLGTGRLAFERNFNPEMGFIERFSAHKDILDLAFKPRFPIRWLRQTKFQTFLEYLTNPGTRVENKNNHYNFELYLESGDRLAYRRINKFERLLKPLRITPGVSVPHGDYKSVSSILSYTSDPARPLAGNVRFSVEQGYFGGRRVALFVVPQWKPAPSFIIDLEYRVDRIELPQRKFQSHIANLGVNYSLSTRFLTSTVFQYNNTAQVRTLSFRLNYIYRPGDDLFVVFRDVRNGLNPDFSERALLVKLTRSFDF